MPYKKGPNNTARKYDSSTGRYIKEDIYSLLNIAAPIFKREEKKKVPHHKISFKENLEKTINKSHDSLIKEIYEYFEKKMPNKIIAVNVKVFDDSAKGKEREIDIITHKQIIEVKSKSSKHALKQFLAQQKIALKFGKKHIVYAPNISKARYNEYTNHGIHIVTKIKDLIGGEK